MLEALGLGMLAALAVALVGSTAAATLWVFFL
jgi:hypothetical protein